MYFLFIIKYKIFTKKVKLNINQKKLKNMIKILSKIVIKKQL